MEKPKDKLSRFHMERRKRNFEKGKMLRKGAIVFRYNIHKVIWLLMKLDRILSKEKIEIQDSERVNYQNVIFAATHIGGNDIQRIYEAIRSHTYLLFGDPGDLYRNFTGLILYCNGVIWLETRNRLDRNCGKKIH